MTRAPDLDSLKLLVLVGQLGSVGAAAERVGISQPTASHRLSTLERSLGLVLLERSRRGSRLTEAGHMVVGWSQRVLDDLAELMTGAEALRVRRDAELHVAASMTIAEYLAPSWIGQLRGQRPDLYVGLQVTNSERVAALVGSGAADLGFIESPHPPAGLATRPVAHDRLIVVVANGHPWARRRKPLSVEELAATPLVVREAGSGTRETLDEVLGRAGVAMAKPLLELGSATAVRSAVIAATGPAVVSELAVRTDIADGRLAAVSVDGLDLRRVLRAVWPNDRKLVGPAAELLAVARRR
ncbi:LysR family transcriptional regulator [Actinospica sp. MGRD01-02]|uniref:LysR family transcriptional regulator n=1 Tax=Actinospica acidithermotolerans TaxID=2828514 RepID=A0A941IHH2_9ACTN|nr:LysR family transcriptional regulator [Actinospica acidithermotolerans]MBR7828525.1 LysR family transcriptional regulator [Actinospica acidithermotolerans]